MQNGITKGGARKLTKCVTALLNRSQILDEIILTLDESDDTVDTRKLMCDLEVGWLLVDISTNYCIEGKFIHSQGYCTKPYSINE